MKVKVYVSRTEEIEVDDKFAPLTLIDSWDETLARELEKEVAEKVGIPPCECEEEQEQYFTAVCRASDDEPMLEY